MNKEIMTTNSPEETLSVASHFACELPKGSVVGLCGSLGAGKTVFVQGMAEGLGIDPDAYVRSPTFALIHEYSKKGAARDATILFHFDLYRLNSFDELIDIGLEDYISREGIVVLEWADRFEELGEWLSHRVEIEILDPKTRQILISTTVSKIKHLPESAV